MVVGITLFLEPNGGQIKKAQSEGWGFLAGPMGRTRIPGFLKEAQIWVSGLPRGLASPELEALGA